MAANEKYLTQSDINIESITWSALKTKRSQSGLTSGKQYRITDYTCTTAQASTRSAGHVFDIIVTADSTFTLNEVARAVQHAGDTYFNTCDLNAWKIWYCLDNDNVRFDWANTSSTGRGVIYRMIDEHNNDCPYDFKNIQYNGSWGYWAYTFNWINDASNNTCKDLSVNGQSNQDDGVSYAYSNVIMPYYAIFSRPEGFSDYGTTLRLNKCVFLNKESYDSGLFYDCHNNTFGTDCYGNTFEDNCFSNTFGNDCSNNIFITDSYQNTFGNHCNSNKFGMACSCNTFGNNCSSNTLGGFCNYNIFGNNCYSNTFGSYCESNTFGTSCSDIKFVTSSAGTTTADYYYYNTFDSGVAYVNLYNSAAASNKQMVQYYHIVAGVKGMYGAYKNIRVDRGRTYDTTVSKIDGAEGIAGYNLAMLALANGYAEELG